MKRRTIAATIAVTTVATGSAVAPTAGTALAGSADQPAACTAHDLSVTVTHERHGGAGNQAFAVHYRAAHPDTNCALRGTPTDVAFRQPNGDTAPGVAAAPAPGPSNRVIVDSQHSGLSYFLGPTTGQENPIGASTFNLPGGAHPSFVHVAWPHQPVHGAELRATPVVQA